MADKIKQGVAETFDASQSSEAFFSKNKKVILGAVAAVVIIMPASSFTSRSWLVHAKKKPVRL